MCVCVRKNMRMHEALQSTYKWSCQCTHLHLRKHSKKAFEEHVLLLLVLLKILTKPKAAAIGARKTLAVCTHIPV